MSRIGGMDFDVSIGTELVHVTTATLTITDNTAVALTRGVPDGFVKGDVSAEGELELDEKNFKVMAALASAAGSWRGIEPFDILFYAKAGDTTSKVEAFGCKPLLTDLINITPSGGEKATKKVKFIVTDPEFVSIDGVSVLSTEDVRDLVG